MTAIVVRHNDRPPIVIRERPAGGGGVADHGALTGLGDDDHVQYQLRTEKGVADGYAGLDSEGEVPPAQLATAGTPDNTTFLRGDQTWATPPGGVGAVSEEFVQAAPLATWTINHTLPYRPAVTVIDGSGTRIYPQVDYVGASQVVISHASAETGTVLLS